MCVHLLIYVHAHLYTYIVLLYEGMKYHLVGFVWELCWIQSTTVVIKHGKWESTVKGGFIVEIMCKLWIFDFHVCLPVCI